MDLAKIRNHPLYEHITIISRALEHADPEALGTLRSFKTSLLDYNNIRVAHINSIDPDLNNFMEILLYVLLSRMHQILAIGKFEDSIPDELGTVQSTTEEESIIQDHTESEDTKSFHRENFNPDVVKILENWFLSNLSKPYPTKIQNEQLANETGLSVKQVITWMQNARKRWKQKCAK